MSNQKKRSLLTRLLVTCVFGSALTLTAWYLIILITMLALNNRIVVQFTLHNLSANIDNLVPNDQKDYFSSNGRFFISIETSPGEFQSCSINFVQISDTEYKLLTGINVRPIRAGFLNYRFDFNFKDLGIITSNIEDKIIRNAVDSYSIDILSLINAWYFVLFFNYPFVFVIPIAVGAVYLIWLITHMKSVFFFVMLSCIAIFVIITYWIYNYIGFFGL